MKRNQEVTCEECGRSAVIRTPVVELFGCDVGYGAGGAEDQFVDCDSVRCYECNTDDLFQERD